MGCATGLRCAGAGAGATETAGPVSICQGPCCVRAGSGACSQASRHGNGGAAVPADRTGAAADRMVCAALPSMEALERSFAGAVARLRAMAPALQRQRPRKSLVPAGLGVSQICTVLKKRWTSPCSALTSRRRVGHSRRLVMQLRKLQRTPLMRPFDSPADLRPLTRRFPRPGRLHMIFLRPAHRAPVLLILSAQALAGRRLEGDRSALQSKPQGGESFVQRPAQGAAYRTGGARSERSMRVHARAWTKCPRPRTERRNPTEALQTTGSAAAVRKAFGDPVLSISPIDVVTR